MLFLLSLAALSTLANSLAITHDYGGDDGLHGKATSYQNIHMEHFHPVPTYIKKEDKHLLEHPISLGSSSSKVEIHHGGKHDHGYATASVKNDVHGLEGFGDFGGGEHEYGGQEGGFEGHAAGLEEASLGGHEAALGGGHDVNLVGHEGSLGGQEDGYGGQEGGYGGQDGGYGGHEAILAAQGGEGHESVVEGGHGIVSAGYEVHDQGSDYSQFQGQLGGYDNLGAHYGNEEH